MQWWAVGLAANLVIAVAYLGIAVAIGLDLRRAGSWRANPIAAATAAIFASSALGRGAHFVHLAMASGHVQNGAAWETIAWWPVAIVDLVTAGVGIWYWSLRGRYPALVRRGGELESLRQRQRQALDIHDNVVQGLALAKLSFELGEDEAGLAAVDQTLAAARSFVTDLLGDPDIVDLRNGALRRSLPAGPH